MHQCYQQCKQYVFLLSCRDVTRLYFILFRLLLASRVCILVPFPFLAWPTFRYLISYMHRQFEPHSFLICWWISYHSEQIVVRSNPGIRIYFLYVYHSADSSPLDTWKAQLFIHGFHTRKAVTELCILICGLCIQASRSSYFYHQLVDITFWHETFMPVAVPIFYHRYTMYYNGCFYAYYGTTDM